MDWKAIKKAADDIIDSRIWNPNPTKAAWVKRTNYRPSFGPARKFMGRVPADILQNSTLMNYPSHVMGGFRNRTPQRVFPQKPADEMWENQYWSEVPKEVLNAFRPLMEGSETSLGNGAYGIKVDPTKIRGVLYGKGNEQRMEEERRRAYANRWARLYQMAGSSADRKALDMYRAKGYIPPIVLGNPRVPVNSLLNIYRPHRQLIDAPVSPNEPAWVTLAPGRGRSWASPQKNQAFIGRPIADGLALQRLKKEYLKAAAHELAHLDTPTAGGEGFMGGYDNGGDSVVSDIKGGDEGDKAGRRFEPGSYELDPSELTRLIYLQKAAAARLGQPAFTTYNQWRERFGRETDPVMKNESRIPLETYSLDNPLGEMWSTAPGEERGKMDLTANYSATLNNTIRTLEKRVADTKLSQEERDRAAMQLEQIKRAIQDAIDMAATGKQNSNMMTA